MGTIQYGTCLFGGGALWFLFARVTGFFWGDQPLQFAACLVLLALITGESLWAHMPGYGNEWREFAVNMLTSAAIAGSGMAILAIIFAWLPR